MMNKKRKAKIKKVIKGLKKASNSHKKQAKVFESTYPGYPFITIDDINSKSQPLTETIDFLL